MTTHSRAIYGILDFLGDVGGLFDALKLIAAGIISLFTSGSLPNYLVSKLFFFKPKSDTYEPNGDNLNVKATKAISY